MKFLEDKEFIKRFDFVSDLRNNQTKINRRKYSVSHILHLVDQKFTKVFDPYGQEILKFEYRIKHQSGKV